MVFRQMSADLDHRTACLRIPDFPLQVLYLQREEWRGKKVAWLDQLKPDAPLRYLSAEARAMGLEVGTRYASALGLVPNLLAGSCTEADFRGSERSLLKVLYRFTPSVCRGSDQITHGLYRLDVRGLAPAFQGMERWADRLLQELKAHGWEARVVVGYSPFGCEMATYRLSPGQSYRLFEDREQEFTQTLSLSLSVLDFSPDQVRRLERFGVSSLEDFLALDAEEIRCRFGADLVEVYLKASQALLERFEPLPPEEPLWAQSGLPEPLSTVGEILAIAGQLLGRLLPCLSRREEAVGQILLGLILEDGKRLRQRLTPSFPTADRGLLEQLISLRLESFFRRYPLRRGQRVERVVMALTGESDPEKQGELFSSWDETFDGEARAPRDRQAALWALSRLRAEYGEGCLRRAVLHDHPLPGRDFSWEVEKERLDWLGGGDEAEPPSLDARVRRHLSSPVPLICRDRWPDKEGPYQIDGGWWEEKPYHRQYFFAFQERQTGWLYRDEISQAWFAQGWLQ